MKISKFLNEYDYLGKDEGGDEFKVWKNPSPDHIRKALNKLDNTEYLRGELCSDGNLYIATSDGWSLEHIDVEYLLVKYGKRPEFPAHVYKNEDVAIYSPNKKHEKEAEKLIKKFQENNGNWNLYYTSVINESFINEYDYQGKANGKEFPVFKNPTIYELAEYFDQWEKGDYLRGYIDENGNLYVAGASDVEHDDLLEYLETLGLKINFGLPAAVEPDRINIWVHSRKFVDEAKALRKKAESVNPSWVFKMNYNF